MSVSKEESYSTKYNQQVNFENISEKKEVQDYINYPANFSAFQFEKELKKGKNIEKLVIKKSARLDNPPTHTMD